MKRLMQVLVVAAAMSPVRAADNAGFALWKAAELQRRDVALSQKIGADHSARETLADYTNHRFRLLRRDGDGFPEQHDNIVDVVIVQSGEGTLVWGARWRAARPPTRPASTSAPAFRVESGTSSGPEM